MSEKEEEEEGEGGAEEGEEDLDGHFHFYLLYTKPLVLELPSPDDRALAAAWVQKLEAEPESEEEKRLRVDYLKLLLFVMQRGSLLGMFQKEPPEGPLLPFPQNLGLSEMGNLLLEQAELQGTGDSDGRGVSYSTEISNDLKEFVAAQEIPNFGVQMYYAWSSTDPIHKWTSFDDRKFPQYVRDKIRQLKIANSEEKTDLKSSSVQRDKADGSQRRSCDSNLYDKSKVKVKSPQEIEKCLELSYRGSLSSPEQRGSMKDRSFEDGVSPKKSRSSRKSLSDCLSSKVEPGAAGRLCGQGVYGQRAASEDVEGQEEEAAGCLPRSEDDDLAGGMRGGRVAAGPCLPGRSGKDKSGEWPCGRGYIRKAKADGTKQLQKCVDAGGNGAPPYVNGTSYAVGARQRNMDRCNRGEMYAEPSRCGGEDVLGEKLPYLPARGHQMNQAASQPSMKSRKTKCSGQGNQSAQEDLVRRCVCTGKGSGQGPNRGDCPCPCPRADKATSQGSCGKRKEKDKYCSKSKPVCTEAVGPRKGQAQRSVDEGMKPCKKSGDVMQMPVEPDDGCPCKRKYHLENTIRSGQSRASADSCGQEMTPHPQQYTSTPYPKRKSSEKQEKRCHLPPQQQSEYAACGGLPPDELANYDKNRRHIMDAVGDIRKKLESHKESCGASNHKVSRTVDPAYCTSNRKTQEGRRPSRSWQSEGGACYGRNQGSEFAANCKQQTYPEEQCRQDVKGRNPNASRQPPPCSVNSPVGPSTKASHPLNTTYTCAAAEAPKSTKTVCRCTRVPPEKKLGIFDHNISVMTPREFKDELSTSSEDIPADYAVGQECVNDMGAANNVYDECLEDDPPCEDNAAVCSSSSGNVPCGPQNLEEYGPNEWQGNPQNPECDQMAVERQRKTLMPTGCSPCNMKQPYAPQPAYRPQNACNEFLTEQPQRSANAGASPRQRLVCGADQRYLSGRRRSFASAQDFQENNGHMALHRNPPNYITSTPYNDAPPPEFDCSSINDATIHQRSKYNKDHETQQFVTL